MRSILIAAILLTPAIGQTRLDLGNQSRDIDFSQAQLVRPFRTGATLPVTCVTGEMFFKLEAAPGSNVYGCVSANTWAPEGVGATLPFKISRTDSTTLGVGSDCTTVAPCSVRVGATVYTFRFPATVSLNSGSGLTYIYINSGGNIVAGSASSGEPSLTCSGCTVVTPVSQFPLDSIPLAVWNATAGSWDLTGNDNRAVLSGGRTFSAGPNIIITETGNEVTISATVANPAESGGGVRRLHPGVEAVTIRSSLRISTGPTSFQSWAFRARPHGPSAPVVPAVQGLRGKRVKSEDSAGRLPMVNASFTIRAEASLHQLWTSSPVPTRFHILSGHGMPEVTSTEQVPGITT